MSACRAQMAKPLRAAGHDCAHASAVPTRAGSLAAVVIANLEQVTEDLAAGALIVISDTRIRARRLPMKPSG